MPPAFLIVEGRDAGKLILIDHVPFTIGRLPANGLPLNDEQVSRQHARVEVGKSGPDPELVDLRSRNGVFVNQVRIERHSLTAGDRVRMGGTVLMFYPDEESARLHRDDLIPDSPDLALQEAPQAPPPHVPKDEPTAIRFLSETDSIGFQATAEILDQAAKLFRSGLGIQGVASQLLDILFQGFAPDRAQVSWQSEPPILLARSRAEGRQCPTFGLPEEVTRRLLQGGMALQAKVPVGTAPTEVRSVLVAPLWASDGMKGWLYADRARGSKMFHTQDSEKLETLALLAGGILERSSLLAQQKRMKDQMATMEKYLTPDVVRMLSQQGINIEESSLSVEEREVSILFTDIQGFTPLSERLSASEIAALLNEYFQRMVDVIGFHHGEVNKFIGDAIMALFGAPKSHGNDAVNAVSAGLDMLEALSNFWREIDEKKRFNIRIGINTGKVVAGNIGSEKRMEYTVLGDEVNVASRLEGISPPNTITIGVRTAELVKSHFRLELVPDVKVKGKSKSLEVYRVLGRR